MIRACSAPGQTITTTSGCTPTRFEGRTSRTSTHRQANIRAAWITSAFAQAGPWCSPRGAARRLRAVPRGSRTRSRWFWIGLRSAARLSATESTSATSEASACRTCPTRHRKRLSTRMQRPSIPTAVDRSNGRSISCGCAPRSPTAARGLSQRARLARQRKRDAAEQAATGCARIPWIGRSMASRAEISRPSDGEDL